MDPYRSFILFLGCLIWLNEATAQQAIDTLLLSIRNVDRDVRLDSLVARHARVNLMTGGMDGYRVQLYSGSGTQARQEANALRAEFMSHYPDIPAYVVYQAPSFKVRVGDFRTELEAVRLQRDLAYRFPGGFVVKDRIQFPELDIEKEKEEPDSNHSLPENSRPSDPHISPDPEKN